MIAVGLRLLLPAVLNEERYVLFVNKEAVLGVRNLDIAVWGQELARAQVEAYLEMMRKD